MIDETAVITNLSRLMGKRTLPQGDLSDWESYCQTAFDYCWRYYKWDWSLRTATVTFGSSIQMPADFDIGGYREAIPDSTGFIAETTLSDYSRLPSGLRNFALQYNATANRYEVLTKSGLSSMNFIYQVKPPTLVSKDGNGNYIPVPFPSAMTVAMVAAIYAKQGENPTRADVKQEWDIAHHELNRHVGRVSANVKRPLNLNLQDEAGTYTGDTRV